MTGNQKRKGEPAPVPLAKKSRTEDVDDNVVPANGSGDSGANVSSIPTRRGTIPTIQKDPTSDKTTHVPADTSTTKAVSAPAIAAPAAVAAQHESNCSEVPKDIDLAGSMKKYTRGSVSYENVLIIKWHLWDGLSFGKIAKKYKTVVICEGKCREDCQDHHFTQQATSKRYQKWINQFFQEFPEAMGWQEERASFREAELRRVRNGSSDGTSNSGAENIQPEWTSEKIERVGFQHVVSSFTYTVRMKGDDGKWFACLVPKIALPHELSSSGALMEKEVETKFDLPIYTIKGPPTSRKDLHRYEQCVATSRDTLPVYDFLFKYTKKRHDITIDWVHLKQKEIHWAARDLMRLFILASYFGNDRVTDMVTDEWIRIYRAEELARLRSSTMESTEITDRTDALELDPDEILYMLRHTVEHHPVRLFWEDVLAAKGVNVFLSERTGCEIRPDKKISKERSDLAKDRLWPSSRRQICGLYHLHKQFNERCYANPGEDPDVWDPQPQIAIEDEIEDQVDDLEERLVEELEDLKDQRLLTDEDYQKYEASWKKGKNDIENKIRSTWGRWADSIDRLNREVAPKEQKDIPDGFYVVEEGHEDDPHGAGGELRKLRIH